MARRNLAGREDIPADVLRQRRDMYVLAIGLLLYNLAGGDLVDKTTVGGLLPVSLESPWLLLCAAWVGFFYFWFRFWLISEVPALSQFREEAYWQGGDATILRKLASEQAQEGQGRSKEDAIRLLLKKGGPVPKVMFKGLTPSLRLNGLKSAQRGTNYTLAFGPDYQLQRAELWPFWRSWILAYPKAMVRERTFTDYLLPHLVAAITVVSGAARCLFDWP